ncbi:MAG: RIP metalloprotease RseP [Candidatus Acidiferrales bacterium]
MTFWLFWVPVAIVMLGLMVLVHEAGHFVIARLVGVRVEVFSIGFGPRLAGVKRGATDYRVSAVPLGGYVKMAGDQPGGEDSTGSPDEFFAKPRWQRTLIVLGGPTVNILTAIAVLAGVYAVHYERPAILDEPPVVASVLPDSPAAAAGVKPGDRILRIGVGTTATWDDVRIETALASPPVVPVEVQRGEERLSLEVRLPERQVEFWELGWLPDINPVVGRVVADGPAGRAGLRPGDVLLAMNGEPLRISPKGHNPISERLQKIGGQPIVLTIEREGKEQDITVTPEYGDHPDGKRWLLGLEYGPHVRMVVKDLSLGEAVAASVEDNIALGRRMLDLVARLFTGRASLRGVAGPVGIVHVTGTQGEAGGWLPVLNLTAAISLSLGILNLLPIPILDGGHILFFAIEGVLRRDLSLTLKERLSQAALAFFLLIFALVMYNDIARILSN